MTKTTQELQQIEQQIQYKLQEKERYERDFKNAEDRLNRDNGDTSAAREVESASEHIKRAEQEIRNLESQKR